MPGMDGLAVIRAAQEARPRLPVVLMTGYVDDGVAIAVREAVTGSYSVLCKPFRLHELVDRIQQLLAARENAGTNQLASWYGYAQLHPNEHVNMCQSTNDV
jgi:FixJ family two-component response regulator